MEKKSKICFEKESDTSVLIKRNGKSIGRVWSESKNDRFLPYPHNDTESCKNSVQICGFDSISEIWGCGVFEGKKDCVISFNTIDRDYDKQKLKEYEEYVKTFFSSHIKELKTGCDTFNVAKITVNKDISKLKSFNDWSLHNL